jgi:hypothetical protein
MINELYEKLPVEIVFQILRWCPHKNVEMITEYWNKRNHKEKSWGTDGFLNHLNRCIEGHNDYLDDPETGQDGFYCFWMLNCPENSYDNLDRWENLKDEFGLTEYHQIFNHIGYDYGEW